MIWQISWLRRSKRKHARVYLDWAAAAPVHPVAMGAFNAAATVSGNPSSTHDEGQAAKALLEKARTDIARVCAAKSRSVVFTSGATEANALAIEGRVAYLHRNGTPYNQMHALLIPTAHASTRAAFERIAKLGVVVEELPLGGTAIDMAAAATRLRPETVLVSCDAADSETGIRYDTRALAQTIAKSPAKQALLHVDASQLPLAESVERTRLGADMLVLDAQKIGGVRGIGALIGPGVDAIDPLHGGGGQERGLRSGTEPVQLAAAFAAALRTVAENKDDFANRAAADRKLLCSALSQAVPQIHITEGRDQLPHILSISLPSVDTEYLSYLLDAKGYAVSTRSACDVGKVGRNETESRSRSVFVFTGDDLLARSTLRISWGPTTPSHEIQRVPAALASGIALATIPTV